MKIAKLIFPALILFCLITSLTSKAQIVINEYSCANIVHYKYVIDTFYYDSVLFKNSTKTLLGKDGSTDTLYYETYLTRVIDSSYCFFDDNFGKKEDWIELYNSYNQDKNIGGYFLSDNVNKPDKYKIPNNVVIPALGFIKIWASGRDTVADNQIHANFKLTQSGNDAEYILLSDPSRSLLNKVTINHHLAHHSMGRVPDGSDTFMILTHPTPDSSNSLYPAYKKYTSRPDFDIKPGFYNAAQMVTISYKPDNEDVFYTLDGTEPDTSSLHYTGTIEIAKTSVLKARSFPKSGDLLSGFIRYATYFINENHTLPVVSISATMLDSLANGQKEIKPWGSIEYFNAKGELKANSYGEFNSHGQDSWTLDQRSLDFVSKDQLGYSSELKAKFFANSDRKKFQKIILRASGDDNYPATTKGIRSEANLGSAHLRDAYFQNLCKNGGMHLDVRTGSKCVVYLNGNYWGVYDIREVPDDHDYTKYYYNQSEFDLQYILTWGQTWAEYGGDKALTDWNDLRSFILENPMSDEENFKKVTDQLDVYSLADYVIGHSMSVSSDWLLYNTGWWRGLNPEGDHKKWGYILWDNDAAFAFYINYTGIRDTSASAALCNVDGLTSEFSDPQRHIDVLNALRKNPGFNNYYIMRYNDLMNTTFSCENMLNQLDSLEALIEPEMHRHIERWPGGSFEEWKSNVKRLRHFIERRCGAMADSKLDSCYDLTGPYQVKFDIEPKNAGELKINSLVVKQFPWDATYFGGTEINIEAHPYNNPKYYFNKWHSNFNSFNLDDKVASNKLLLANNDSVIANFSDHETDIEDIIINNKPVLYPNLVNYKTSLYLKLPQKALVNVSVVSASGKSNQVYSGFLNTGNQQSKIDIVPQEMGLTDGFYIVNININGDVYYEKFIYQSH